MTRVLIVSEAADEDINGYIAYTNERSPEAARRFLVALHHAFAQLLSMPEIGHVWRAGIQRNRGSVFAVSSL